MIYSTISHYTRGWWHVEWENVWTNTYVICRERHNKVLMSLDPSIYNKITGDKASQIYEYKVEDDEMQYAEIET